MSSFVHKLKEMKEGTLIYHHLHGIVKFVKFDYGYTIVDKQVPIYKTEEPLAWGWERIAVISQLLVKYDKKIHGELN